MTDTKTFIYTREILFPPLVFGGKKELQDYRSRLLSQNGEEGVLLEILKRINNENEFCVEFGAGNGMLGSNSALFRLQYNWDYLLFEIDDDLIEQAKSFECEKIYKEYITPENINEIFEKYKVPNNFGFLSIDIDGDDIYVLEALDVEKYSPNIILIEFNPALPNQFPIRVMRGKKSFDNAGEPNGYFGANLIDYYEIMEKKGYKFVTTVAWNAFFIKKELFEKLNIPEQTKDMLPYHTYGEGCEYWLQILSKDNFLWVKR